MLNFIILDDEKNHAKFLKLNLENYFLKNDLSATVKLATSCYEEVLDYLESNFKISVYFLDINLNSAINGIEIAHQIRKIDKCSYIIYTTAHIEYSLDGYKTKTFDFLTKPIKDDDLKRCCDNLFEDYNKNKTNDKSYYWLKSGSKIHKIDINEIVYFNKYRNTIEVTTKKETLKGYDTLKNVKDIVETFNFVMPNKSMLINIDFIQFIDLKKNYINMINDLSIPITRHYKQDIKNLMK